MPANKNVFVSRDEAEHIAICSGLSDVGQLVPLYGGCISPGPSPSQATSTEPEGRAVPALGAGFPTGISVEV